ncbi:MAG: CvpA family protein [Bacilli bacterium]
MNFIDIIIIVCLLVGAFLGFKKGVIKTLVQLIGMFAIIIISYTLKDMLAGFLIKVMPFFNFGGVFEGVTAINIIMYELISFIVIFVVLYCILNILISLSGMVEKLLKLTIVLAIPSKILGLIVGAIEGLVFSFLLIFILFHVGPTTKYVNDSSMGIILLERTPFIGQVMAKSTLALEEINDSIKSFDLKGDKKALNSQVVSTLIYYNLVDKDTIKKLIEDKKLDLENMTFS